MNTRISTLQRLADEAIGSKTRLDDEAEALIKEWLATGQTIKAEYAALLLGAEHLLD